MSPTAPRRRAPSAGAGPVLLLLGGRMEAAFVVDEEEELSSPGPFVSYCT